MTDDPKFEIIEDYDYPEVAHIEGDGWRVAIKYDEYPDNPRDWTNCWIGTMMTSHSRYNFGNADHDIQLNDTPETEIECPYCGGTGSDPYRSKLFRIESPYNHVHIGTGSNESMESEEEILSKRGVDCYVEAADCPKCNGDAYIEVGLIEYIKRTYGATVILPIYLYDHSGLSMSAGTFGQNPGYPYNDQWDAGMVGVIFDTPEQIELTGIDPDPENIEKALRAEIDEYDDYLRGNVFFIETVIDDMPDESEMVGGYVGQKWAEQEALSMAEWADQRVQEERATAADWAARDVITTKE